MGEAGNGITVSKRVANRARTLDLPKSKMALLEMRRYPRNGRRRFLQKILVNFPDREVLIPRTALGEAEWRLKLSVVNSNSDDCFCIVDTCFNGGDLCSFNCAHRRKTYLRPI